MSLTSPFKRSPASAQEEKVPAVESAQELVIDAEATDLDEGSALATVTVSSAMPQAASARALERRSDRDLVVRNVAVATAGGLVAGAATIAVAVAAKTAAKKAAVPSPGLARRRRKDIVQSQSFLVDVHVLKPGR